MTIIEILFAIIFAIGCLALAWGLLILFLLLLMWALMGTMGMLNAMREFKEGVETPNPDAKLTDTENHVRGYFFPEP